MANPERSCRRDPFLRLAHGGRFADVAFPDLNLLVLFASQRWFYLSPPGSVARRRARLAMFSITLGVAWGLVGPPTFETGIWGIAALSVLASLYLLIFY